MNWDRILDVNPRLPIDWPHYVRTVLSLQGAALRAANLRSNAITPRERSAAEREVAHFQEPTERVVGEFMADVLAAAFHGVPPRHEA